MAKLLRWLGIGVGGIVVALLIACVAVLVASNRKLHRVYAATAPAPSLMIATDSATISRGRHLAVAIGKCVDCHGEDLGGHVIIPDPKFALVVGPNLTKSPAGLGNTLTNADIARAIRHGIKPDGTPILLMPSASYWSFGDADLSDLISWVRSMPPVNNVVPVTKVGPIGRAVLAMNQLPIIDAEEIDHAAAPPPAPPAGPTKEYGAYLTKVGGCVSCHGPTFSGGHVPGSPPEWKPAANITPATTAKWTEADFVRVLREGKTPQGIQLDTIMPYRRTRLMTDEEIHAVWLYLQSVPAKEFGGR